MSSSNLDPWERSDFKEKRTAKQILGTSKVFSNHLYLEKSFFHPSALNVNSRPRKNQPTLQLELFTLTQPKFQAPKQIVKFPNIHWKQSMAHDWNPHWSKLLGIAHVEGRIFLCVFFFFSLSLSLFLSLHSGRIFCTWTV